MGNKEADRSMDPENNGEKDFNAGGNDSDYDGGQPKDVYPESEGRIDSGEENVNKRKENAPQSEEKPSFNAGGNDSDYDGGHPKDVNSESEGRIDSSDKNPEDKD